MKKRKKKFKINKKAALKFLFVMLLLWNVLAPVVFTWLVEIGMDFKEDVYYTNGFWNTTPMKMYHIALNFMINVCLFTSAITIYNIDRIIK